MRSHPASPRSESSHLRPSPPFRQGRHLAPYLLRVPTPSAPGLVPCQEEACRKVSEWGIAPLLSCLVFLLKKKSCIYMRRQMRTPLLWQSFHIMCKSNHHAVYLKLTLCCVSVISHKLEKTPRIFNRPFTLHQVHPESSKSEAICACSLTSG